MSHTTLDHWRSATRATDGTPRFDRGIFPQGAKAISALQQQGKQVGLRISLADCRGFELLDASTFAGWGIDFACIDDAPCVQSDPPEILSLGLNLLHGAQGPEAVYQLHNNKARVNVTHAGDYLLALGYAKTRREHEVYVRAEACGGASCVVEIPRSSGWNSPARAHGVIALPAGESVITLRRPGGNPRYEIMARALAAHGIAIGEPKGKMQSHA